MADLNTDPLYGTMENVLGSVESVSGGIESQSTEIGEATGLLIVIALYVLVILAVIGILFVVLKLPKRIMNELKNLKSM